MSSFKWHMRIGSGVALFWLIGFLGWIINLVNVVSMATSDAAISDATMLQLLELIGVFAAPLGSFLGLLSLFS